MNLPSAKGGAILLAWNLPGDGAGGNSKNASAPLSHVQAVEIRSLELRRADSGELSLITLTGLEGKPESSLVAAVIKRTKAAESSLGISVDY